MDITSTNSTAIFLDGIEDFDRFAFAMQLFANYTTSEEGGVVDSATGVDFDDYYTFLLGTPHRFGGAAKVVINPTFLGSHDIDDIIAYDCERVLVWAPILQTFLVIPRFHKGEAIEAARRIVSNNPHFESFSYVRPYVCPHEGDDSDFGEVGLQHYVDVDYAERVDRIVTDNGVVVEDLCRAFRRLAKDTVGLVRQEDGTWEEYYPSSEPSYREDFHVGRMVPC